MKRIFSRLIIVISDRIAAEIPNPAAFDQAALEDQVRRELDNLPIDLARAVNDQLPQPYDSHSPARARQLAAKCRN